MLSVKNIFQKNNFHETILRRKLFYVETNGVMQFGVQVRWAHSIVCGKTVAHIILTSGAPAVYPL